MRIGKYFSIFMIAVSLCMTGVGYAAQRQNSSGGGTSKQVADAATVALDAEEYAPYEIIKGKWGTRPGEFGYMLIQAPGEVSEGQMPKKILVGPDCIFVSKEENVYVLDQINKRLQQFSPAGVLLTTIPLAFPKDVITKDMAAFTEMYVDAAGFIYVSYNIGPFSWFVFDKAGALVKRLVDKKSIEYQVRILGSVLSQKQRKEMLEGIMSDSKTLLVDVPMSSARYGKNGEIYVGNMRLKSGALTKMTSTEMKSEDIVTASQKAKGFISKAKKTIYKSEDGKQYRLADIATGEQAVSSNGEVYKIIKSSNTSNMSDFKVIRWRKIK